MKALRENGLTTIFKKLTADHSALELKDRDHINLNLIAHELLDEIKKNQSLHIPVIPHEAIDYSDSKDIRAIDYCLFQLTHFERSPPVNAPIYPHHVAAAMYLLNAAFYAYKKAQKQNIEIFPFQIDLQYQKYQKIWTQAAASKVLDLARYYYNVDQKAILPEMKFHPFPPEETEHIPTILKPYFR